MLLSTSSSESQSSGPSNSARVSPIFSDADIRFCFSFFDSFLKEVSFKLRVISAIPRFTETPVGGSFSARPKPSPYPSINQDRSQYEKRLYSWFSIQWVQASPMYPYQLCHWPQNKPWWEESAMGAVESIFDRSSCRP
ncbi:unnamed protein product, partial [Cylindrotheca closterium]